MPKPDHIEPQPKEFFVTSLYIQTIELNRDNAAVSMLVRFGNEHSISSVKHLYCKTDQLATLLMIDTEDAGLTLSYVAYVLSADLIDGQEIIDVEEILGRPLSIIGMKLQVRHPLLKWSDEAMKRFEPNYYVLDNVF